MPATRLKAFLDGRGVPYTTTEHAPAYTTQRTAEATHLPGHTLIKTVIVKLDGALAMVVVPACDRVRLDAVARAAGAVRAELATEEEFRGAFPDVEIGAMPPFGNLYGLPVYVSEELEENPTIAFNAGTHTDVMTLRFADFRRLANPTVVRCSTHELMAAGR
jgi:Ala-tRNA(Pro) deacylase